MPVYFGPDLLLLERLAAGGMAEVFRAKQLGAAGFQKSVAVKRILPNYASRQEFKAMFQQEMKLCAGLQHPNIVQVYRNGEHDGYLYLVMEFVDGKTIDQVLHRIGSHKNYLPIEVACFIALEAAKGLHHAHTLKDEGSGLPLNIVHRDISPQNIMVGYNGEVKIVDFGIAKAADQVQVTRTGELKGKIGYIAPERWEGQSQDQRSDIYALGVVLHEMLSGRHLFGGENTFEIMHKVSEGEIPALRTLRPDVPELLEQIVNNALKSKAQERYQSAEDFLRAISLFMNRDYPEFVASDCAKYLQGLFAQEIKADQRGRSAAQFVPALDSMAETQAFPDDGDTSIITPKTEMGFSAPAPQPKKRFLNLRPNYIVIAILVGLNIAFGILVAKEYLSKYVQSFSWQSTQAQPISARVNAGLLSWLKADALELKQGDKIEKWRDSSFSGHAALQFNQTSRPKYETKAINNLPVVHFDGRSFLISDKLAQDIKPLSALTLVCVARAELSSRDFIWSIHAFDQQTDIARMGFDAENRVQLKTQGTNNETVFSSTYEIKDFAIYTTVLENVLENNRLQGKATVYKNGAPILTNSQPMPIKFSNAVFFSIGQEWDHAAPSDFFNGDLAEMLIFGQAPSDEERKAIETYLSSKYAIKLEGS